MEKLVKFVLDEIEETGEVPLKLLIPKFLNFVRQQEIHSPVFENGSNYDISDNDFEALSKSVIQLMKDKNLSIYQDMTLERKADTWEENFEKIDTNMATSLLMKKDTWLPTDIYKNYYLSES